MAFYRDDRGALYWSLRGDITGEVVRDTPFHKDSGTTMLRVREGREGHIRWTLRVAFGLLVVELAAVVLMAVAWVAGMLPTVTGWAISVFTSGATIVLILPMMMASSAIPQACERVTVRGPLRLVVGQSWSALVAPLVLPLAVILYCAAFAVVALPGHLAVLARVVAPYKGVAGTALAIASLMMALLLGAAGQQAWLAWKAARRQTAAGGPPRLRVAASRDRR